MSYYFFLFGYVTAFRLKRCKISIEGSAYCRGDKGLGRVKSPPTKRGYQKGKVASLFFNSRESGSRKQTGAKNEWFCFFSARPLFRPSPLTEGVAQAKR